MNSKFDVSQTSTTSNDKCDEGYFKLPYIGKFLIMTKQKLNDMVKRYCKEIDIKLIFNTSKIKASFSCKDKLEGLKRKSYLVYKFSCAGCNSSYIGETTRHFSARTHEHLNTDKNFHLY